MPLTPYGFNLIRIPSCHALSKTLEIPRKPPITSIIGSQSKDEFILWPIKNNHFKRVSNFRFLMPVSLVQWRGEIGVFYGKFQVFFNISACCLVAATSDASISHNFCFTKLLALILNTFFSRISLSYHKKSMTMSS